MRNDVITPAAWEVVGMGLLVLGYLIAERLAGETALDVVNTIGPGIFGALLLGGSLRMALADSVALWLGHFWFRVASGVYFGFGGFLRITFNDYTEHLIDTYYWAQPHELFKANLICALGVFVYFATSYVAGFVAPHRLPPEEVRERDPLLLASGFAYCLIGYSIKFLVVLPYTFNAFGRTPLPGLVANIVYLAPVGLFLVTTWCATYRRRFLPVPTILLGLDMFAGTLQFAKNLVILPLIVYLLALLRTKASVRSLAIAAGVVLFTFQTLVPAVQYGRAQLELRTGSIDLGSFTERQQILINYLTDTSMVNERVMQQNTLSRFYYGAAMAAAVTQYDTGKGGGTLYDIVTILIPRSIWPDKPVYNVGARFNMSVVGDPNSSTWMGIFVESYWNFGWWGIVAVMIPLALANNYMARVSIDIIRRGRWIHFPIVLMGMWMGMRVDSDVVQTQFVGLVLTVLLLFIANRAEPLVISLLALNRGAVSRDEAGRDRLA